MTLKLDHVVIAVNDLNRAVEDYKALGFTVIRGGVHVNRATHNALVVFSDGTYIELLARTGEEPIPNLVDFSSMMDIGEGLAGFALYCDDIEGEVKRLKDSGFKVAEIAHGSREKDGRVVQWKLALIDDGFAPFLIQDITPREWRVPTTDDLITHANHAVGIPAVEIAVREMKVSWEQYTKMIGIIPKRHASNHREIGSIVLHEYVAYASKYALDELPDFLKPFAGKVSHEEITQAQSENEPDTFANMLKVKEMTLLRLRQQADRERAMDSALGSKLEALFAIHLIREEAGYDAFIPERTHGVYFQHLLGASKYRGMDILTGLDEVNWSSVNHAYGSATDVPDLLRALTSENFDVRDHAHEMLIGNIVHQGTIYEASIATIPFLMKILDAHNLDKTAALDLLGYITFGGVGTPELAKKTRSILDDVLPLFVKNLFNMNAEIRAEVADQLALYPSELNQLEPLLQERITSDPDPQVRANCLRSLTSLWINHYGNENESELSVNQQTYINEIMADALNPVVLRFHAALMLTPLDTWLDSTLEVFYDIMKSDHETLATIDIYYVFYAILNKLKLYPEIAIQWVLRQAEHPENRVRDHVAGALRNLVDTGQPIEEMLPTLKQLLYDKSATVREATVGFFYNSPYAIYVKKELQDIAEDDLSLTVRTVAQNTLNFMR
jgi:catechol 2,3-dioxygenase-like lactoylglutathione lyase family enzyme